MINIEINKDKPLNKFHYKKIRYSNDRYFAILIFGIYNIRYI